jgi:hypothetical protein
MTADRKVFLLWAVLFVLVMSAWLAIIGGTGAAVMWAFKHIHLGSTPVVHTVSLDPPFLYVSLAGCA